MVNFKKLLWTTRFMEMAKKVAGWSKDPSTKIGAVIVKNRHIKATGYNGFPAGIEDTTLRYSERDDKYRRIVHAEMNAILQAGHECQGATIYIHSTQRWPGPCSNCAKHIITAGIAEVVISSAHDIEANPDCQFAREMLLEAGVVFRKVDLT